MRRTSLMLVVGLAALSLAGPAVAQGDDRARDDPPSTDRPADRELDRLKEATLAEIDRRIGTLERLESAVTAAPRLTPNHREALSTQVGASLTRLLELRASVEGAETLQALGALVPRIVGDYWVFALIVPKVHEVIAADSIASVAEEFSAVHGRISRVIEAAASAGLDVTEAADALRSAQMAAAEARALAASVPPDVLPISPDQMPDQGGVLVESAERLGEAFDRLGESVDATKAAIERLRLLVDQSST